MLASLVYALTLLMILPSPAAAQESRAEAIAQQQERKAATLTPSAPSSAERTFLAVKEKFLDSPGGLYPLIGSVYGGGGFTLGGGFRQYYGDRAFWNAKGLWSIKNYKLFELSTDSPGHAQSRLDLNARAGWRDAPQVAYYGLGMATSSADRADFRFVQAYAGAAIKARPIPWIVFGAQVNYEDNDLKPGLGPRPSIEESYTSATAPGLGSDPNYLHSTASAGIDWRPAAGYARRGGLYEMRYHNYNNRNGANTFDRLEAEVVQHVPILRENWVISLHGVVNTTVHESDTPPYFLLPSLGSGDTLRGYGAWRFRDRHSMLMQTELRWIPSRTAIDMAIFYDAGKVTSRRNALDLDGLKSDAGIEMRFHGPAVTPLRLGIARGNEGWRVVFGGAAAF